jgi:hypothetical protein
MKEAERLGKEDGKWKWRLFREKGRCEGKETVQTEKEEERHKIIRVSVQRHSVLMNYLHTYVLLLLLLLLSVGPAESRRAHCSLPRLIVLTSLLVPPFISRGALRRTA